MHSVLSQVVSWTGGIVLAAAGMNTSWQLFLLGCVLLAAGSVWSWRAAEQRRRRDRDLTGAYSARAESLQLEEAITELIHTLVEGELGWRVSIYELDAKTETWMRRLRRASSEILEQGGRSEVPMDRSYLRRLMDRDLTSTSPPVDVSGELPHDPAEWIRAQIDLGYEEGEASKLRMKSRQYGVCAARLEGRTGGTVGVVIEVEGSSGSLERIQLQRVFTRPLLVMLGAVIGARELVRNADAVVRERRSMPA